MATKPTKYNYLTWEIDTTGRYLLDEMCRMSARHEGHIYDEYIMPYRNITYASSRKIGLYTVSVGVYRLLRKTTNGMVMKTNTEIVALKNFLNWLVQFENAPVILMCYEPYEYSSYILLQALQKYELLDKFKSLVYGFADVYALIKRKCKRSVSSMSLRTLAKILLNRNTIRCLDSQCRADLVHEILMHLSEDSDNPGRKIPLEIAQYVSTVDEVNERLSSKLAQRTIQSSLKPIFVPYLVEYKSRRKAIALRNLLTYKSSNPLGYDVLKEMWSEGPENFKEKMFASISGSKKDVNNLIGIISFHFEAQVSKPSSLEEDKPGEMEDKMAKLILNSDDSL